MKSVNSATLRASIGKVVDQIEKDGEPVILEKHNQPVAVLISLQDFRERFVEKAAREERLALAREMEVLARPSKDRTSAQKILRDLRDGA